MVFLSIFFKLIGCSALNPANPGDKQKNELKKKTCIYDALFHGFNDSSYFVDAAFIYTGAG